jgi:hypothetical protein
VCVCGTVVVETICHDELYCCSLFDMKFKHVGMVNTPFQALILF